MKKLSLVCMLLGCIAMSHAQHVYKIKTDSLKVTNDSCTAELILENSTKHINGFLYNKGNGRTEFRKPVVKMGDSVQVWDADTLLLGQAAGTKHIGNGLTLVNDSIVLGGVLDKQTRINQNRHRMVFNITDGVTPYKGGDVTISGVRDTISDSNNLYIQHRQTGSVVTGHSSAVGSVFAETWYNTADSFRSGTFANFVSRHKSSWNTRMQNLQVFGFRSFFETYDNGRYGDLTHFHASHVWGSEGHIRRIYGLRLSNLKGINTQHSYAIYTDGVGDSIVLSGPMRLKKYANNAAADSLLTVDSIGNLILKAASPAGLAHTVQELTDSTTVVWNLNDGINGEVLLEGAERELKILNPQVGYVYKLKVEQDATGGRTINTWPANTLWPKGVKPVFTNNPNSVDIVSFYYDGTNFFGSFEPQYLSGPPNVSIHAIDSKIGTYDSVHTFANVPAGSMLVLTTSFGTSGENAIVSSNPTLTWAKRADASAANSGDSEIYTAYFASGGNINVTSRWEFPYIQASTCYVIVNSENTFAGASVTATAQAAPSASITSTRANSILIGVTSDWNARNGSARTLRSGATETNYSFTLGDATGYHYYLNAPTIGGYTMGVSSPSTQSGGTCVIEIRGQ